MNCSLTKSTTLGRVNVSTVTDHNFPWRLLYCLSLCSSAFGIATVLGYLFTGILLGPDVFNIASDPEAIQELAEFGVILLMFLIGLELRPQRLWSMRSSIFGMGSLQVGLTGLLLA